MKLETKRRLSMLLLAVAVIFWLLRQLAEQIFDFSQLSLSAVGRVRSGEEYANWLEHGTF